MAALLDALEAARVEVAALEAGYERSLLDVATKSEEHKRWYLDLNDAVHSASDGLFDDDEPADGIEAVKRLRAKLQATESALAEARA
jgi:hypothetical protein